jgi:CRP-like cAMP-binding protein
MRRPIGGGSPEIVLEYPALCRRRDLAPVATDLFCYGLTFWEFRPLVEGNGAIAWKLLQALAKRLRAADPN